MKQKHFFSIGIICLSAALFFAGCNNEDEDPVLSAPTQSVEIAADGTTGSFTVSSNIAWSAAVDAAGASWCSINPASGTGDQTITVTTSANTQAAPRTATITISGEKVASVKVTVTQVAANSTLDVAPLSIQAEKSQGTYSIAVTSNNTWTAVKEASATWCSVSPSQGTGSGTVTVVVAESALTATRTAKITISAGGASKEVVVTQDAGACIPATVFTLKSSGTITCPDGDIVLSLTGTQIGINYNLYDEKGAAVGSFLPGTGSAATFHGKFGAGTYTAKTIASSTYCKTDMEGTIVIASHPALKGGSISTTGELILLNGTPTRTITGINPATGGAGEISYQWYLKGTPNVAIPGATATDYLPPASVATAIGTYVYIREAKDNFCGNTAFATGEWTLQVKEVLDDYSACTAVVASTNTGTFQSFSPASGDDVGTKYSLTDTRDNKVYQVVKMPDGRYWMAQNLNFQKDLTFLAAAASPSTFQTSGSYSIGRFWCPAAHNTATANQATCDTYGALYTFETAMMVDGNYSDDNRTATGPEAWDESWISANYLTANSATPSTHANAKVNNARSGHGICPKGWHIPTDNEWSVMLDKVNGDGTGNVFQSQFSTGAIGNNDAMGAGARLKSVCSFQGQTATDNMPFWNYTAARASEASDMYGFRVIPTGYRTYASGGVLSRRGQWGYILSSTAQSESNIYYRFFDSNNSQVSRSTGFRSFGLPVRCIKD